MCLTFWSVKIDQVLLFPRKKTCCHIFLLLYKTLVVAEMLLLYPNIEYPSHANVTTIYNPINKTIYDWKIRTAFQNVRHRLAIQHKSTSQKEPAVLRTYILQRTISSRVTDCYEKDTHAKKRRMREEFSIR